MADLANTLQTLPGGSKAPAFDEDWRYTSLASAIDITERWIASGSDAAQSSDVTQAIAKIVASVDADCLVIANGVVDASRIAASSAVSIEERAASADSQAGVLQAVSHALGGKELLIGIHQATERPLALLYIDSSQQGASVANSTVTINVDPGCDVEVIEYHHSLGGGDHYANSSLALNLKENSTTRLLRVQDRKIEHVHTANSRATLARNATLYLSGFDLGGGLVRNDLNVDLVDTGSSANFSGLYLAGDGQHIDNHTRVDHRVGPATSSQEYRGILNGRCRCIWNGKAIVHEGADGTDANQANHNLLLSEQAEINTKPELEIYAEDVKCSHGTTVGQLDESALFYLQTRGIDKAHGRQMLTRAFAADLVAQLAVSQCVDWVSGLVERRLANLIEEATQ